MNPFLPVAVQERLVLASASPRRREILRGLGFEFEVAPAGIDEEGFVWSDPVKSAKLVSELKAVEAQKTRPLKTIIAADTIVLCGGERLGKPSGPSEAAGMLRKLSGMEHEVVTGVTLAAPPNIRYIEAERTKVFFRDITDAEIARYIDTGEPFDKAGAYGIQGHASIFIERVEGCYFNVVGLPVPLLFSMFRRLEAEKGY